MFSEVFLLEYTSFEMGNIYDIFILIQHILRADAESFPLQNVYLMEICCPPLLNGTKHNSVCTGFSAGGSN